MRFSISVSDRKHLASSEIVSSMLAIRRKLLRDCAFARFTTHTLWNRPEGEIRPLILWGLGGAIFEAFCNAPDHLVEVVENATDLPELALLEEQSGLWLRKLTAKGVELFDALTVAADQVADGPAGDQADAGRHRHAEEGHSYMLVHADCSRVVGACSWSTRWMVVREAP